MKKKQKLSQNYLDTIYQRNPDFLWQEKENLVIIDMENRGFYHWIAQKFFHKPRVSHIKLDEYGSTLWKLLDGNHTVFEIVCAMQEQFSDEKERMMDRVVTFLRTLETNHFIKSK